MRAIFQRALYVLAPLAVLALGPTSASADKLGCANCVQVFDENGRYIAWMCYRPGTEVTTESCQAGVWSCSGMSCGGNAPLRLGSVRTESGELLLVVTPPCAKERLLAFSPGSVASVTADAAGL